MLGLSGYDSSDEEKGPKYEETAAKHGAESNEDLSAQSLQAGQLSGIQESKSPPQRDAGSETVRPADAGATSAGPSHLPDHELSNEVVTGPHLGPSMLKPEAGDETESSAAAPSSPYTSARQANRNLTMPPVPNFDIPASPPGSPIAGSTEKFTRFHELKKKGVHFNEKLEKSSALRNPNLLQKLREFAGIDGDEQYASSLPDELAVPTEFPNWAYADELNKLQAETLKRREKERAQQGRESVAFVPASVTTSASSSRSGTPGSSGRVAPKSAAERVMAGLNGERGGTIAAGTKRTDSGQRKTRFDPR